MSDDMLCEPWCVDVTLRTPGSLDLVVPMRGASWTETRAGWQLGGHIKGSPDLSEIRRVRVLYPDGSSEEVELAESPAAHCRTGHPWGTFTTLLATAVPQWPGAAAQHEAMLQQLRDDGFTIEGDD